MFTGIIEEIGEVLEIDRGINSIKLTIKCSKILEGTKIGDSISVNGVCLTVVRLDKDYFVADVMPETMNRSSFATLKIKDRVNLERAMLLNGRFGGHIVSGHIDGIGTIRNKKRDDNAIVITIKTTYNITKYIVTKGSVALDGISLTVTDVKDTLFEVSIIPHTLEETSLKNKKIGDKINIECDMVGKYVEKFVSGKKEGITYDFLAQNGFV